MVDATDAEADDESRDQLGPPTIPTAHIIIDTPKVLSTLVVKTLKLAYADQAARPSRPHRDRGIITNFNRS